MATSAAACKLWSAFFPAELRTRTRSLFRLHAPFAAKIRASSTAFVETAPTDSVVVEKEATPTKNNILACPICYEPLTLIGVRALLGTSRAIMNYS